MSTFDKRSHTCAREESFNLVALCCSLGTVSQQRLSSFESQKRPGHVHAQPGQVEGPRLWYTGQPSWIPRPTESVKSSEDSMATSTFQCYHHLPSFFLFRSSYCQHDCSRQVLSPCDAGHVRIWSWAAFKNVMCIDMFWNQDTSRTLY